MNSWFLLQSGSSLLPSTGADEALLEACRTRPAGAAILWLGGNRRTFGYSRNCGRGARHAFARDSPAHRRRHRAARRRLDLQPCFSAGTNGIRSRPKKLPPRPRVDSSSVCKIEGRHLSRAKRPQNRSGECFAGHENLICSGRDEKSPARRSGATSLAC